MWHHRVLSALLLAGGSFLLGAACASRTTVSTEPSLKTFYDEARQIMTADEAEVFKSLPDEASRAEFIREFWAVRDPKPETPENEARVEFEKRARYAALWFGAHNPYKGSDPGGPLKNLAGLNDERGRTYILLGTPDVIIFFDGLHETESRDGSRSRLQFDLWILEQWIYDRLNTHVIFRRDDGGEWYHGFLPVELPRPARMGQAELAPGRGRARDQYLVQVQRGVRPFRDRGPAPGGAGEHRRSFPGGAWR